VNRDVFVLVDEGLDAQGGCLLIEHPAAIVRCDDADGVDDALEALAKAIGDGACAAGFFSFELGYLFEPRLRPLLPRARSLPLLWFALSDDPVHLGGEQARAWLDARAGAPCTLSALRPAMDRARYARAFARAHAWIAAGDAYQVNLTFPQRFAFRGDPVALYADLRRRQRVAFGALIAAHDFHVLSLSPELFLQLRDGTLRTRPMKGTAPRGLTPEADAAMRRRLASAPKTRAENLMIVDLLRNDLARVAEPGSVRVTDLFTVETYRSLHQMTSGIEARLRPRCDFRDVVRNLFPCGSVTGAPKIRAMEIIRALEPQARGVYTGAIGMLAPGGRMSLNVAIRTLVLDAEGSGTMGVGSGLVYDSEADDEYEECLLKARFVAERAPPFALIETLRWHPNEGYARKERHLARLAASAAYFGFPCDGARVRADLDRHAAGLAPGCHRVRLTLDEDGRTAITSSPMKLPDRACLLTYVFSPRPVRSDEPMLYHKTTRRQLYEQEYARVRGAIGCDEVIFVNERGEVTEGSRTNVFVEDGGLLRTPPVSCGLLDGTLRRELLDTQPERVREAPIRPKDLDAADAVWLGNSVRGLLRARRLHDGRGPTCASAEA
jgi:para-aminobenzoate synthetase/4-amino-4-deoxychorismate lyase